MAPTELGSRLRKVREVRKMSLRDVAQHGGISSAYLHKLERGEVRAPSPHVLYALAEALEIPYSQLMQLAGYVVPTGSEKQSSILAHALSSEELTEDEAEALASYLAWYRHDRSSR